MKWLFLLCISLLVVNQVRGSHMAGGHLHYNCVGPNTYDVTLTIFRDCDGILFNNSDAILRLSSISTNYLCTDIGQMNQISNTVVDYGCGGTCLINDDKPGWII